jgi:hypothetical protein
VIRMIRRRTWLISRAVFWPQPTPFCGRLVGPRVASSFSRCAFDASELGPSRRAVGKVGDSRESTAVDHRWLPIVSGRSLNAYLPKPTDRPPAD